MATNAGITEDTTARKNTKGANMHSALEVEAILASHKAYVSSMVGGYETQIKDSDADHAEEIKKLKQEHTTFITATNSKHETSLTAIKRKYDTAFADTNKAHDEAFAALKKELTAEKADAQRQQAAAQEQAKKDAKQIAANVVKELTATANELRAKIVELENAVESAKQETNVANARAARFETGQSKKIKQLERKLENAGVAVQFCSTGRKARTIWGRPTTPLKELAEKLGKDLGVTVDKLKFGNSAEFKVNVTAFDVEKTLAQLNIADGYCVYYKKMS